MSKSAKSSKQRIISDVHSSSCVSCAESRLEFSKISWIQSNNFINSSRKNRVLERKFCPQNNVNNDLLVVGKIRTRFRAKNNQITDFIGKYNLTDKKFYICGPDSLVYDFGFCSVLNIDKENSYKWVETNMKDVQDEKKYLLRVAYDSLRKSVQYVGTINRYIGSINSIDFCLEASKNDNKTEKLKSYDILCLKPSPASLKQLCRLKIRKMCKKDNLRIKTFYRNFPNLVDYLKYPNSLKCTQCLLKGDSIVSENSVYKLTLLENGDLVFYINDNNDFIFLYENVDCLNFNEFSLIVNFNDKTCKTFITDFDDASIMNYTESKLIVSNAGFLIVQSPFYDFRYLIQFRDDLPSFLNLKKPNFMFTTFFEKVKDDDEDDDDDLNDNSEDSDSDTDSDSDSDSDDDSDDDSIESGEDYDKNSHNIQALNKLLIGNRAKTAVKK
jgi:hypothetical protein